GGGRSSGVARGGTSTGEALFPTAAAGQTSEEGSKRTRAEEDRNGVGEGGAGSGGGEADGDGSSTDGEYEEGWGPHGPVGEPHERAERYEERGMFKEA
ncbi:unnamed protein product, partial [Laminaria digitata]